MSTPLPESGASLSFTKVEVMEYVCVEPFVFADNAFSVGKSSASLCAMFDRNSFPDILPAAAIMCVLNGLVSGELTKLALREC